MRLFLLVVLTLGLNCMGLRAQEPVGETPWAEFVEPEFPFFGSAVDARALGEGYPEDNLTPRGLVLNLGQRVWLAYDLDLLRVACLWRTADDDFPLESPGLAPGSYHVAGQKTKDGQDYLAKPRGEVWLSNGLYAGVQSGESLSLKDPRPAAPDREEVGRGPLPLGQAQLKAVHVQEGAATLEMLVNDSRMLLRFELERSAAGELAGVRAQVEVSAREKPLLLVSGLTRVVTHQWGEMAAMAREGAEGVPAHLVIPAGAEVLRFSYLMALEQPLAAGPVVEVKPAAEAWVAGVETRAVTRPHKEGASYVTDGIPLPVPNPWKRNVRLADVDFLNAEGDALGVTFDGDVWKISGLKGDLDGVTWRRVTSGFHEPMSLVVRQVEGRAQALVYDRNGIWELVDEDGDGWMEQHRVFCNRFAQTAETREFANAMKLGPGGEIFICKGGQEGSTRGLHNGTVLKISADGGTVTQLAHGLRQPFIGVHPETGLVTASDQQGQWVPSTPIHHIRDDGFYGHQPHSAKGQPYPEKVTEPLLWIPHPVNPSGATQVWALDERFGPVAGEMIHVGYNRPEIFRVIMAGAEQGQPRQGAIMSFSRDFDFGPLNGKMNPADGQLYLVGFQVWGTTATALSGLARIRYTGEPRALLTGLEATDKGFLLSFNARLDPVMAVDPDNYSAERWNYVRSEKYGSPHLKTDGSSGQEWLTASAAYLSEDGTRVLVAYPDMQAGVHQMRIGWGLQTADGLPMQNTAYLTPWELAEFDPVAAGFGDVKVDLTPRRVEMKAAEMVASVAEGEKLYQMFGCMACHSIDGTMQGKVGPSWKGLYGSERELAKHELKSVLADEAYLRESILNPNAKVVKGFEKFDTGMPIYEGILNEGQVESLVLYIKSLK